MAQITVYVPASLVDEIRVAAARQRIRHGDVIVQACVALADQAADLIVESRQPVTAGGFQVSTTARTKVQFGFRISGQNQRALDDLIEISGANDRSHLVTTLVTAYLGQQ